MKKLIGSIFALFGAYAVYENCAAFSVRREGSGKNLRIVQISDIHMMKSQPYLERIIDAAKNEAPDLIFITGDLVSRTEDDFNTVEKFVKKLCTAAPVYMCIGNHEQSLPKPERKEFFEAMRRTDAVILKNECAELELKGEKYSICGVMPKYSVYKKKDGYKQLDVLTVENMTELLGERPEGNVLLLAHNPNFAKAYAKWGADYTFSGHVHGGVVRLFGVGLLSPERNFFPKYTRGIYKVGRMKLCVTSGIGKLRLFNPPEIVVYDI